MKMKYRPGKCKTAPFCPKRREKKIDFKWQLQPNSKIKTQNQRSSSSSSVPSLKGSKRQWILFLFFPALFHFFLGFMLLDLDMLGFFFYGWICNFWNVFFFFYWWICGFVISDFVSFVLYWWICPAISLLLECNFFHSSLWQFFVGFLLCNLLGCLMW